MNRQQRRKLQKSIDTSLNRIVSVSTNLTKQFNVVNIPLISVKEMVKKSMLKFTDPDLMQWQKDYNETLNRFYLFCIEKAGKDNAVSLDNIKYGIEIVKTGIKKGMLNE